MANATLKRAPRDWALLGRIWSELGSGRITEAFIIDGHSMTDGVISGKGHIVVNPAHQTVDTVIHEVLHRLNPSWSEQSVRRTTTYLRKRMSDEEVQAMYDEFQKRSRKRKRPVRLDE